MTATTAERAIETAWARRLAVLGDPGLRGREFCEQLSTATDDWIRALVDRAREQDPAAPDFAVIAVGGYGRGELAPFSDIDLLLVHESKGSRLESVASGIWYPIWDAGIQLGHAVRSLDEHLTLAKSDLDTATALLTARPIAGDADLGATVVSSGLQSWTKRKKRWLSELQKRVRERQANAGDVAYILEPDVKDGHGGIRDAQSLWWAECGGLRLTRGDNETLNRCYDVLLEVRVALHRATGRGGDTLRLEDQDAVSAAAGAADADALMADIAAAARTVAWIADETWGRVGKTSGGAPNEVAPGVMFLDGEMELAIDADPAVDPTFMLRMATAAARHDARIGRKSLDRLTELVPQWPAVWPVGAIDELVALLLEGHRAIPVIEALDQRGLITRMLPEWEPVRSRPQRNAYHRFTVDRHLWEAAANASELVDMVARPDLLVLGALFHDLGKGYPGDHTEAGMELLHDLGPRLGLNEHDVDVLVAMIEHHLLLPDVAVRRDLSDPATIRFVADRVLDQERLELLHALTIADSKATGPSAWGGWKEELVADLATRVAHVVGGGEVEEATWTLFPNAETVALMAASDHHVEGRGDRISVVYRDNPGSFSRIAGVLSLHGLDVVSARAHSDEPQLGRVSMGASEYRVQVPPEGVDWAPIEEDMRRALVGQLAIEPRLAERARTYRRQRVTQAAQPAAPRVTFEDGASSNASVLEVRCATRIGILYRITRALAGIGLDIRHATVQTVGMEVVDTFYVRTWAGELVDDEFHRAEVERAVLHAISSAP
ncbi:MAG: [protein-PII] uridylyltransferase [Ilumatobacter sp.]|uniref:[protein-PII] uridylyltransferase n=1 Tax=Ilumatobacter sp. TaxID=1967498 RepID=UPI00261315F0|nr:[protein-PII] uridylyltransferase [Ilumatobacter sp.]MDJ0768682.1 [protein-PII] uridylyltransferase [Ilumatobacter sp.]